MTEEELRKMIREALGRNTEVIQEEEGLRTPIGMEQKEYPVSYAKQLPPGLLNIGQVDMPGTDGKQVMLQQNVELPVGSVNLSAGYMPTFGQKNASVGYSMPIGDSSISVSGNVTTDPRNPDASKSVNAAYRQKIIDELYFNAYVNQLLNGKSGPQLGIGIQGLF